MNISPRAGVEIVAAAPRYRSIRVEVALETREDAEVGETVRRVTELLDQYLHPLVGGDDGQGWPFGGTLSYFTLQRRLASVTGVSAVSPVNLVVDGLRIQACSDYHIADDSLFWPEGHQVIVLKAQEGL